MVKKILLGLLILFLALITGFFTWRYMSYVLDKDPYKTFLLPRVELTVLEITSLTAEKIDMNTRLLIDNQLPFSCTADSLQYSISIDSVEILRSRYKKSITLERNDSSWIALPLTILMQDLKEVILVNERKNIDSVEYHLEVSFYTNILFRKKYKIDIKRTLPLFYLPEVSIDHIEVDSLNFSRAAIEVVLSINNKNVFPIQSKNIAYKLAIEDNEWIEGIIPGLTDIKSQDVTEVRVPMRISFKEVSKSLFHILKKGRSVKYKLHLTLRIESENNMVKNSKVILESSGTVKSLMKALKENMVDKNNDKYE